MLVIHTIVHQVIGLYFIVIFVSVAMSWLIGFGVVNRNNKFVNMVWGMTTALTEPLLRPIQRVIPSFGGIDLSPIVLLIGLNALQVGLHAYVFSPVRV